MKWRFWYFGLRSQYSHTARIPTPLRLRLYDDVYPNLCIVDETKPRHFALQFSRMSWCSDFQSGILVQCSCSLFIHKYGLFRVFIHIFKSICRTFDIGFIRPAFSIEFCLGGVFNASYQQAWPQLLINNYRFKETIMSNIRWLGLVNAIVTNSSNSTRANAFFVDFIRDPISHRRIQVKPKLI